MNRTQNCILCLMLCIGLITSGCSTVYYGAWEKLGKHKRDLLKDNVEEARTEQQAAKEQFQDTLAQLKELYGFQGGELEEQYDKLNDEYEEAVERAESVRERIEKVEQIANDLFKEWKNEIETISNEKLRADSRTKLEQSRRKYESLQSAMRRAEKSMEPVLVQFRDHVIYLKHNLNARAIGSLGGEITGIEKEIAKLIKHMNVAITESDNFIQTLY